MSGAPDLGEGGAWHPPLYLHRQLLSSCDSAVLTEESDEAASKLSGRSPRQKTARRACDAPDLPFRLAFHLVT